MRKDSLHSIFPLHSWVSRETRAPSSEEPQTQPVSRQAFPEVKRSLSSATGPLRTPQVLPEVLPQPQPQKHNFSSTVEYSLPTQRYGTNESVQGHGTCLDNSPTQLCPKPDEKRVHSCSLGWAALPTHSHPSWGDTCTYHLRTPTHPPMQASVSVTCFAK